MLGYWSDLERRLFTVFGGFDPAFAAPVAQGDPNWPHTSVYDAGEKLVLVTDLPGFKDKDLEITLERDILTLAGARDLTPPEGHTVHRQERRATRFSRTFNLPYKVDADALTAQLKDGVLTITLPKAAEARARKIAVQAG